MEFTSTIVILMLLLLVAVFVLSYIRGRKYKSVIGTLEEVETHQLKREGTEETFTAYVPVYKYEVDGEIYKARGATTEDSGKYVVGSTREMIYNSQKPKEVHLYKRNHKERMIGKILVFAGIGVILIAFLIKLLYS